MGVTKTGPFDIDGELARSWLSLPLNPNGRPNTDVLKKSVNGEEITGRSSDRWIIDFGVGKTEAEIAFYEVPFSYAYHTVRPFRLKSRQEKNRVLWWQYERPWPSMWKSFWGLSRYIATSMVAKHRLFVWLPIVVLPENLVIVIACDDDTTFGILHSHFHEIWALRLGTSLEDRPRYTPSTTFETFPFPEGLTPNVPATEYANDLRAQKIAIAAKRLDELRKTWLNPPDLVVHVPEVVPGYPDRILPKNEAAAVVLKKRTLTNLYNERPAWLDNAHRDLDEAVAGAYGWKPDMSDDEILTKLLALNVARAKKKSI
jgi:type II restriction/modification system DNA methylase subunit YeeA